MQQRATALGAGLTVDTTTGGTSVRVRWVRTEHSAPAVTIDEPAAMERP